MPYKRIYDLAAAYTCWPHTARAPIFFFYLVSNEISRELRSLAKRNVSTRLHVWLPWKITEQRDTVSRAGIDQARLQNVVAKTRGRR